MKGLGYRVDRAEITNQGWYFYLTSLEQEYGQNASEYQAAVPDMNIWQRVYDGELTYPSKWAKYPIVGITHAQAVAFCEWRTKQVRLKFGDRFKGRYDLPTAEQWQELSATVKCVSIGPRPTGPLEIKPSKWERVSGVCGNVSEFLRDSTQVAGGSWKHGLDTVAMPESGKADWLGFRCVVVE